MFDVAVFDELKSIAQMESAHPRCFLASRPDRPDLLRKGLASRSDGLFIDFEDAVHPDNRELARRSLIEIFATTPLVPGESPVVLARCNSLSSEAGAPDLLAVLKAGIRSVTFPKMVGPADVIAAEAAITDAERVLGVESGTVRLWLMVETAAAVVNASQMLDVATRVEGVFVGPADLSADLRLRTVAADRLTLDFALLDWAYMSTILVARAHGVQQIMTAGYEQTHDYDGVETMSRKLYGMGFTAVEFQSPRHIPLIIRAWSPSDSQVSNAHAIVNAYEACVRDTKDAVALLNDQGIQLPMYRSALRVLAAWKRASAESAPVG